MSLKKYIITLALLLPAAASWGGMEQKNQYDQKYSAQHTQGVAMRVGFEITNETYNAIKSKGACAATLRNKVGTALLTTVDTQARLSYKTSLRNLYAYNALYFATTVSGIALGYWGSTHDNSKAALAGPALAALGAHGLLGTKRFINWLGLPALLVGAIHYMRAPYNGLARDITVGGLAGLVAKYNEIGESVYKVLPEQLRTEGLSDRYQEIRNAYNLCCSFPEASLHELEAGQIMLAQKFGTGILEDTLTLVKVPTLAQKKGNSQGINVRVLEGRQQGAQATVQLDDADKKELAHTIATTITTAQNVVIAHGDKHWTGNDEGDTEEETKKQTAKEGTGNSQHFPNAATYWESRPEHEIKRSHSETDIHRRLLQFPHSSKKDGGEGIGRIPNPTSIPKPSSSSSSSSSLSYDSLDSDHPTITTLPDGTDPVQFAAIALSKKEPENPTKKVKKTQKNKSSLESEEESKIINEKNRSSSPTKGSPSLKSVVIVDLGKNGDKDGSSSNPLSSSSFSSSSSPSSSAPSDNPKQGEHDDSFVQVTNEGQKTDPNGNAQSKEEASSGSSSSSSFSTSSSSSSSSSEEEGSKEDERIS